MTENQKLREALQAISHIDDATNHSADASAALDRIGQIARQALALPPDVPETPFRGMREALQVALDALTFDGFCPQDITHRTLCAEAASQLRQALIELKSGEHYAGIALDAEGELSHHLILLPGDVDMTWSKASEWAASIGGELPTRQEQALLFANLKGKFEPACYWSNEQHESYADYAWAQDFYDGYQDRYGKDSELRARAVRRVPIHREAA